MAAVVLEAKSREAYGTGSSRSERRNDFIPCVVYGDKKNPEHVCISKNLLNRYVHKSNFFSTVFEIDCLKEKKQKLVAKEIQFHPVTDQPIHIDFVRVEKGGKVSVRVPLAFVNELASPGLKSGGVLNVLVHEIDVACDPENIPDHIEIDVTGFEFHHTVHAHDVKLPDGMSLSPNGKNFTIATILAPTILKKEEETVAATKEAATTAAS
jgi:large subunit ribosomal protein L25